MQLVCNAVFEGGGVKCIGLVGATKALEEAGYQFLNLAGCSAGAILASLLAVGYKSAEIEAEVKKLDYLKFKETELNNFFYDLGIYNADYFEKWLQNLLLKKGKTVFGNLSENKLQIIATDLTKQKLLILPNDLKELGINASNFSIAKAVRMSISIPLFFKPFKLVDKNGINHYIVDGGLLSNYPVWLLDDGISVPKYPTFGFRFIKAGKRNIIKENNYTIVDYIKSIILTALDGRDEDSLYNSKGDKERTINISAAVIKDNKIKYIGATDFAISKEINEHLFNNGVKAGKKFLEKWNFDNWLKTYRH